MAKKRKTIVAQKRAKRAAARKPTTPNRGKRSVVVKSRKRMASVATRTKGAKKSGRAKTKARKAPARPKARKPPVKAPKAAKRRPQRPVAPPAPPPAAPMAHQLSIVITGARGNDLSHGVRAIAALVPAVEQFATVTQVSAWNLQATLYNPNDKHHAFEPMTPSAVMDSLADNAELFDLSTGDPRLRLSIGVVLSDGRFLAMTYRDARNMEEAVWEWEVHEYDMEENTYESDAT